MLLTLLKYLIYDKCIDVIASNIKYNFNPTPPSTIQVDDDTLRVGFGSIWEYNEVFNSAYEIPSNCTFIDDNTGTNIPYDFMYADLMRQNLHLNHDTLLVTIDQMLDDDDDDGYDDDVFDGDDDDE